MSQPIHRQVCWFAHVVVLALSTVCMARAAGEAAPLPDANDPAAILWKKIAAGDTKLDTGSDQSFLRSLLKALDVPVESQVLVFSKTSLQKSLINPARPRAIYFNENCYVGWAQGGNIEVTAVDPERGPQYYLVQRPFTGSAKVGLIMDQVCMSCHAGGNLQLQSVHADRSGYPMEREERFITTYESPLSERWGGWYVTGQHHDEFHMGNVPTVVEAGKAFLDRNMGANVETLEPFFDTKPYLTHSSDIVALMVLEHQYVMQNTLAETGRALRRVLSRPQITAPPRQSLDRIVSKYARRITSQLLFAGEYELSHGGIHGGKEFQDAFRRDRHEASDGSSLKDFDLQTRLFKYRCSSMVYSASFDGLPDRLKKAVYRELLKILEGADTNPEYAYLGHDERKQILRILKETKPDAAAVWTSSTP
jgi:hypothetical protein